MSPRRPGADSDSDGDGDGDDLSGLGPLLRYLEALRNSVARRPTRARGVSSDARRTLKPLMVEDGDISYTFAMLSTQPGFETGLRQLEQLRESIELWRKQGLGHRQIRPRLHVAISSVDEDSAVHFTERYHAFLRARGLLSNEDKLVLIEGAGLGVGAAIEEMRHGMYLVTDAEQLSRCDRNSLSTAMQHANTVVVVNYMATKDEMLSRMPATLFRCHFDLTQVALKDAMTAIQGSMAAWSKQAYSRKITFEGGLEGRYVEAFARRIANRSSNPKTMRTGLQQELQRVADRQTARLLEETPDNDLAPADMFFISKTDLLGREPDITTLRDSKPWKELQAMVGLEGVKASVESFLYGLLVDFHRDMQGQKPLRSGLSKLFIGPPGTGKTTVAKLYGEILGAFGLLTSGELVVKNASNFIGKYVGHSEKITRSIIADARGKVLMIDEAYMLDPFSGRPDDYVDSFRRGVIDTIVGEIQNTPGEDICVIMCGYKDMMERMIQKANPGLARRFPMADAFVFDEFSEAQLEAVLDYKMVREGFTMTAEAKKLALEILSRAKQRPNFGNGGEVANLIGRTLTNYRTRFGAMTAEQRLGPTCFEARDMDPLHGSVVGVEEEVEHAFDQYIAIGHIKTQFKALARRANALRRAGRDPVPFMPFHLVFKGPFGTGKTSMARKMGWFYKSMRLLATDEVEEVSVRDLVLDQVTSGRSKVLGIMQRALGKVLLIDEAHRLAGSSNDTLDTYLQDVRESLLDVTNNPDFKGRVLVVLAGSDKVNHLLKSHPQIANRFRTIIQFNQLSVDQCLGLLEQRLEQEGAHVTLTDDDRHQLRHTFGLLRRAAEWANGRDIDELATELVGDAFENGSVDERHAPVVKFQDILQTLQRRVPQRLKPPGLSPSGSSSSGHDLKEALALAQAMAPGTSPSLSPNLSHNLKEALAQVATSLAAPSIDPPVVPKQEVPKQDAPKQDAPEQDMGKKVDPPRSDTGQGSNQFVDGGNQSPITVKDTTVVATPEPVSRIDDDIIGEGAGATEANGDMYDYMELPKGRYTRLILLQPARDHSEPLHIQLQHHALEQGPTRPRRFDALSYVWGSREKTDRVFCDGRSISVTPNCALAMRHLRYKQGSRVLWIDAICIDQNSLLERNHQVALMGEIYTAAHNVIIWLGTGSPEVDRAIQNIQRLCSLRGDWGEHDLVRIMLFRKYKGDLGNVIGMEHIMRHEWWRRMWTLQEFALAKRPVIVVGKHHLKWDDLVYAANSTISSVDVRDEMARRMRQPDTKKHDLVINHIMPPDEAQNIRGIETSIHLVPMWSVIMDAHASRISYQLGFQHLHRQFVASDFLLKARMRQAKDPRDKLYALYHILQSCHYGLPALDYSKPADRIYEEVTLAILAQSGSWWILSHLFRARSDTAPTEVSVASWVPDYSAQILWHQRETFRTEPQTTEWPHNKFSVERSPDGRGVCCSGIFLWTVTSATSTLLPTRALDRSFDAFFEETRYEVLLTTSEDFLFTLANWLNLLVPGAPDGTQDPDSASETLHAIAQTFRRAIPTSGPLTRLVLSSGMVESPVFKNHLYKVISAIRPCMAPSPDQPCPTCGTSAAAAHEGDDALQHFIQQTCNQATRLTHIVYILYGAAVNRAIFRTGALGGCPGHFGFCGGQPRPGDEVVLLPGASDPVIVRRRPRAAGDDGGSGDCYRIVGVTTGMARKSSSQLQSQHLEVEETDAGAVCSSRFCEVLDCGDGEAALRYKPRSFLLL